MYFGNVNELQVASYLKMCDLSANFNNIKQHGNYNMMRALITSNIMLWYIIISHIVYLLTIDKAAYPA